MQLYNRWTAYGQTHISSAVCLPSRVTHLVIKKPANFEYHPGDYVFVKIRSIASSEWVIIDIKEILNGEYYNRNNTYYSIRLPSAVHPNCQVAS